VEKNCSSPIGRPAGNPIRRLISTTSSETHCGHVYKFDVDNEIDDLTKSAMARLQKSTLQRATKRKKTGKPISYFVIMPPELRLIVYEMLLISTFCIPLVHGVVEPALLQVCKQIRAEASPVFYRHNQFCMALGDFDSRRDEQLLRWARRVKERIYTFPKIGYMTPWLPHWQNLQEW
jgi:hypothetical protein